jgi:hypothetical protein
MHQFRELLRNQFCVFLYKSTTLKYMGSSCPSGRRCVLENRLTYINDILYVILILFILASEQLMFYSAT